MVGLRYQRCQNIVSEKQGSAPMATPNESQDEAVKFEDCITKLVMIGCLD
jgi:hypothetical protein